MCRSSTELEAPGSYVASTASAPSAVPIDARPRQTTPFSITISGAAANGCTGPLRAGGRLLPRGRRPSTSSMDSPCVLTIEYRVLPDGWTLPVSTWESRLGEMPASDAVAPRLIPRSARAARMRSPRPCVMSSAPRHALPRPRCPVRAPPWVSASRLAPSFRCVQMRLGVAHPRQRAVDGHVASAAGDQQILGGELGDHLAAVGGDHDLLLDARGTPAVGRGPVGLQGEHHPLLQHLGVLERGEPGEDRLLPDGETDTVTVLQCEG